MFPFGTDGAGWALIEWALLLWAIFLYPRKYPCRSTLEHCFTQRAMR